MSALLLLATALPSAAQSDEADDPIYLALGDSVAFGFNPLLDFRNPAKFIGHPNVLADMLDFRLTNAACPGEASGGFISLSGTDNGCRAYRSEFPLHVRYTGSQLDFAVEFLRSHPHTRLITLDLGANDLFVLEQQCGNVPSCIQAGLPGMLATLAANLTIIYARLQAAAPQQHQLVALLYYALNYNDPVDVQVVTALNMVIAITTLAAGGRLANGFDAFKAIALAKGGGSACAAGLLIQLPGEVCDIHPSALGREVLAGAFRAALPRDFGG
jgi:hypothetical protein